jgi:hypothetical protein
MTGWKIKDDTLKVKAEAEAAFGEHLARPSKIYNDDELRGKSYDSKFDG